MCGKETSTGLVSHSHTVMCRGDHQQLCVSKYMHVLKSNLFNAINDSLIFLMSSRTKSNILTVQTSVINEDVNCHQVSGTNIIILSIKNTLLSQMIDMNVLMCSPLLWKQMLSVKKLFPSEMKSWCIILFITSLKSLAGSCLTTAAPAMKED